MVTAFRQTLIGFFTQKMTQGAGLCLLGKQNFTFTSHFWAFGVHSSSQEAFLCNRKEFETFLVRKSWDFLLMSWSQEWDHSKKHQGWNCISSCAPQEQFVSHAGQLFKLLQAAIPLPLHCRHVNMHTQTEHMLRHRLSTYVWLLCSETCTCALCRCVCVSQQCSWAKARD